MSIHEKLKDAGIDLGKVLGGVKVEPNCIEFITDKGGVERIFEVMKDCNSTTVESYGQKIFLRKKLNAVNHKNYWGIIDLNLGDVKWFYLSKSLK